MGDLLARLSRLDVCALSDAADALGLPPAVSDLPRQSGAGFLCGRVLTVRIEEGPVPAGDPKVHLGATAIAQADAETVIVISHPGTDCGGWGGVLSQGARVAGVRGVVLDGPTRDVDEARQIGFAIFARRTTARTARGRVHEAETGGPVTIAGQAVTTGDFVAADGSGVVFLPADRAEEIVATAERIAAREQAMTKALLGKAAIVEVLGADYETLLENVK